jgi:hypothetical protein
MQNIKELREDLVQKYQTATTDENKKDLSVFTAAASAIIRSCKTELDYNKEMKNNRKIEFLEVDDNTGNK